MPSFNAKRALLTIYPVYDVLHTDFWLSGLINQYFSYDNEIFSGRNDLIRGTCKKPVSVLLTSRIFLKNDDFINILPKNPCYL